MPVQANLPSGGTSTLQEVWPCVMTVCAYVTPLRFQSLIGDTVKPLA